MKTITSQVIIILLVIGFPFNSFGQTAITVYPDSIQESNKSYDYGVFYVPKTQAAQDDFLNNGDHLNSIRLHIIESALNNSSNLSETLAILDDVSAILKQIAAKTDKLLFIIEKMPPWLSSSSDGSPAQTTGWSILNTRPPKDYEQWNTVVQSITSRINTDYGIDNAYFEIWNEPDLGSWTGTQAEFFELYRKTREAIKSVDSSIPVGGPATNHWANNITYLAPFGYISQTEGELSLISHLIDSTHHWNAPMDFISWHNFNLSTQTYQNAIDFIYQKYENLGATVPELLVSEWNAPSAVRDTDIHYAFAAKNTLSIQKTMINANMIAAWQDFESSAQEFHADYGLLTYGAIRKPVYNVIHLISQLKGDRVKMESSAPLITESTINNGSLDVLITNYAPPPVVEALNHTLFEGKHSINALIEAGYIDLTSGDYSKLEDIYQEKTQIPNSSELNIAINNSIPVYSYYDILQSVDHSISLTLPDYDSEEYAGEMYVVDHQTNNGQYTYDSLVAKGFSQSEAINEIVGYQSLKSKSISLNNGTLALSMKPNSVALIKIQLFPGVTAIQDTQPDQISVYPNPSSEIVNIYHPGSSLGNFQLMDLSGKTLKTYSTQSKQMQLDLTGLKPGVYLLQFEKHTKTVRIQVNN
ncbi:MAG: hypothetical protein CMP48_12475 [Rickettsiales bacterium]|nr:hypothetical protein [Rickettsiales bacterium]